MTSPLLTIWAKLLFFVAHTTTIWMLMALWMSALVSWFISYTLSNRPTRKKESVLAKNIALFYTVLSLVLWSISFVFA